MNPAPPGRTVCSMDPRPDPPLPVRAYRFRELRAHHPDTAAARVPLVVYRDALAGTEPHAHRHRDFFSLYLVRRGRGTHWIEGAPYGVARGDVYAMGLGMTHWFADGEALETDTLHFAPHAFDAAARDVLAAAPGFQSLFVAQSLFAGGLRPPAPGPETPSPEAGGGRRLHLTPDAYAPVEEMVRELRAEWAAGTPDGALLTRLLLTRLLVHLARRHAQSPRAEGTGAGEAAAAPPSAGGAQEATVAAAVRLLDARFAEPLRIEQVAASVFLSPDRFTEVFAATMGRTPRDYLRHLRLERARTLLQTTALPVAEVGQRSGFGEAAYFTRVFRAATGLTPRDFRRGK